MNYINHLIRKKKLIIFIGKKAVLLIAIYKNKIIKTHHISVEDQNKLGIYSDFLRKHKDFHVIFLIDTPETELTHEIVPILQNILKSNPVESFIAGKHDKQEVSAYNVYNISNQDGEVWEAAIAKSPYTTPFKTIIEYVISHSYKYSGTYFLALEFEGIIDAILKKSRNLSYNNDLQIFACVTSTSAIRICVKYKKDILNEATVQYPYDKSDEYVQGTIEQAIEDKIIAFKDYIKSLNLKVCIIILCDNTLKSLFLNSRFGDHKIITVTSGDLELPKKNSNERFVDGTLMALLSGHKMHLGYNSQLRSITLLNLIHSIVFKPFIIVILALLTSLALTKFQASRIKEETKELNNRYYVLSEEYRNIKQRHPEIQNVGKVAELYTLESVLNQAFISPFIQLNKIFSMNALNIKIDKAKWQIVDKENLESTTKTIIVDLQVSYKGNTTDYQAGIKSLNNFTNNIRTSFPQYDVKIDIESDRIINLSKDIMVPAYIKIKGKYEEE